MRRVFSPLSVALLAASCVLLACAVWTAKSATPATTAAPAVSWEESGRKVVPIVSVGNPGVHIGVAQVVGPKAQVENVKAAVQLALEFKRVFRIRVYVPVSSVRTDKLYRVQGCSVWALGELRVVKF